MQCWMCLTMDTSGIKSYSEGVSSAEVNITLHTFSDTVTCYTSKEWLQTPVYFSHLKQEWSFQSKTSPLQTLSILVVNLMVVLNKHLFLGLTETDLRCNGLNVTV